MSDFSILSELGKGSGGVVHKAKHAQGFLVALKVIKMDLSEEVRKHINTELIVLHLSKNENVISLYEAFYIEGSGGSSIFTEKYSSK